MPVIEAKKGETTTGASGFGSVVGVESGKVKATTTVAEFARIALKRDLTLEYEKTLGPQPSKASGMSLG